MVGVIGVNYRISKCWPRTVSVCFSFRRLLRRTARPSGAHCRCRSGLRSVERRVCRDRNGRNLADAGRERFGNGGHCGREYETYAGYCRQTFRYVGAKQHQCDRLRAGSFGDQHLLCHRFPLASQSVECDSRLVFLSEYQVLNLFICGIGTVGGSLMTNPRPAGKADGGKRIEVAREMRASSTEVEQCSGAMVSTLPISVKNLKPTGCPATHETIRDEVIGMNIFNSVFVDCTASPDIASLYKDFLQHNISVVA